MEIITVKIQGDGYLVNGSMFVPHAEGNRHFQEVQKYIADGGIVEEQYTAEELAKQVRDREIAEALKYLADTAWYIERLNDPSSGKAVPEDILTARAEARLVANA